MIYSVCNIKGGVGKTTIAANLAVWFTLQGKDVLVIDGDKQGSISDFTASRANTLGNAGLTCVRAQGSEVVNQVQTMRDKFNHVIIDAGGQDNPSLRAALVMADIAIVPVAPRSFEAWALDGMANLVEEAKITNPKLKLYTVVNLAFPRGSDNQETLDYLREDYPVFKLVETPIVSRKIYSDRAGQGLSIYDPQTSDFKARSEFTDMIKIIS